MNRTTKSLFGGALISAGLVSSAMATNAHLYPTVSSGGGHRGNIGPGKDGILYDQSGISAPYDLVNQVFTDFGGSPNGPYDAFLVDDFDTNGATWNVTSIHTFALDFGYDWSNVTTGHLQFYPKSGSVPIQGTDLAPEYSVPISVLQSGNGLMEISATGLNIPELNGVNGQYWIGLTPDADFGSHYEAFDLLGPAVFGDGAAFQNPGGGFGVGSKWMNAGDVNNGGAKLDMAYYIDGDVVPAPGAAALLGLGGLVAGRRRRN